MCSDGAAIAAQAGRGNRIQAADEDYQIILPQLPTGRIAVNTIFFHGDVKARPYRVEDFRDMLARTGMLSDVVALGAYQINHVWAVTFNSVEATKKMLALGEQEVKGHRCLVIDPQNQQVRLKLHWLLHGVEDEDVRTAFAAFGKVTEVTKERWRVQGVHDKGSTTRTVMLKLKTGVKVDDLPHQIRVAGELALVVAPGRPMQCLRCRATGHVRRECKAPRCSRCRRFGHTDMQCVRTYADVAGPVDGEFASEHVMDATEAEEAASGTGDQVNAGGTSGAPLQSGESVPKTLEVNSGDRLQPRASSTESVQTTEHLDGGNTPEKMDVTNATSTTKRSHDEDGDAKPTTKHVSSEEPPAKTSQIRRAPSQPRPKIQDRKLPLMTPPQQQPPSSSEVEPGGRVLTP